MNSRQARRISPISLRALGMFAALIIATSFMADASAAEAPFLNFDGGASQMPPLDLKTIRQMPAPGPVGGAAVPDGGTERLDEKAVIAWRRGTASQAMDLMLMVFTDVRFISYVGSMVESDLQQMKRLGYLKTTEIRGDKSPLRDASDGACFIEESYPRKELKQSFRRILEILEAEAVKRADGLPELSAAVVRKNRLTTPLPVHEVPCNFDARMFIGSVRADMIYDSLEERLDWASRVLPGQPLPKSSSR